MLKNLNPVLFETAIQVRISDLNYGAHLGIPSLSQILHNTRDMYMRSLGVSEINCFGTKIVHVSQTVTCHQETFFGDELNISIYFVEKTKARIKLKYEVTNIKTEKVISDAEETILFLSTRNNSLTKPPEELLRIVSA